MFWSNPIPKLLDQFISAQEHERPEIKTKIGSYGHKATPLILEKVQAGRLYPDFGVDLLCALEGPEALESLIEGMGHGNDLCRSVCQKAIERRHMPLGASSLAQRIDDDNHYIRAGAEKLLVKFPKSIPIDKIIPHIKSQDKDLVRKAVTVLGASGSPRAVEMISSLLTHSNPWFRKKAVDGLVASGSHDVGERLADMLPTETDADVIKTVVHALSYLATPKVAIRLVPILESEDLMLRQMAVQTIVEKGDSTAVGPVVALMRSKDKNIRRAAADALSGLKGQGIVAALVKALRDEDWWVREIAVAALADRADGDSNEMVVSLLSDEDPYIRRIGAEYFCLVKFPSAYEGLVELLNDEDWWTRERSIVALGRQGDPRALPKIMEALDDPQVRLAVPEALARIPHPDAFAALTRLAASPDKTMRANTAKAGFIVGGVEGKKILDSMAHDRDSDVFDMVKRYLAEMAARGSVRKKG
ncbi:MAG: HEAT repeat domain-containing protein [Nitrospinota bacterium]|nr:HEAT repeat domain-containing protein [Nitrospinota bacterium]